MSRILHILFWLALTLQGLVGQTTGNLVFDGLTRNYIVYAPPATGEPLPLVLVLHGFTQTAQGIMTYSAFNAVAAQEGFVAVYPNGIGTSWNVGFAGNSTADDVGFLDALIDAIRGIYNIDTQRIYACGMSNGGFMSYRLACELSARIAAIASVTGTMSSANFDNCQPSRPVPTLQIHGTSDLVVPYNGGPGIKSVDDVLDRWVEHNNCDATPTVEMLPDLAPNDGSTVERHTYANGDAGSEVMHLKVIGGGHTWPGAASGFSGIGNLNRDIEATREIWEFFNRHTLDGTTHATAPKPPTPLKAWPNPAAGAIHCAWAHPTPFTRVRLLSATGAEVPVPTTTHLQGATLHTTQVPTGFYWVEMTDGQGIRHTAKVVVNH